MQETGPCKIHKLEVTDDTLTSRGGLAFFVKYLEAIGIVGLLLHKFAGIKKSIKGVSVQNLFLQMLYFFFDGTSRHLSYFDELQREEGYQAVVEMPAKQNGFFACHEAVLPRLCHFPCRSLPLGVEGVVSLALAAGENAGGDADAGHHGHG